MRLAWLCLLAACGGGGDADALEVTTMFTVTDVAGSGTSALDALQGEPLALSIRWPAVDSVRGTADPVGCKSTAVGFLAAQRSALGDTAELVQREILDRLPEWDVRLQLCDQGAGTSTLVVESVIDELNLSLGCFGVPAAAQVKDGDGYPALTSFTATQCSATILDVVNNRVLMSQAFSITVATGPTRLP